ncbi:MAG: S-methyl-5-thioribose-1-phosphate isomerase, partial [Actinomycetota bacterium]
NGVPFYVAAPSSTFDADCPDGASIPVEQRDGEEVAVVGDRRVAPPGTVIDNRAFDITPAALVTGYVTEEGVRPTVRR